MGAWMGPGRRAAVSADELGSSSAGLSGDHGARGSRPSRTQANADTQRREDPPERNTGALASFF